MKIIAVIILVFTTCATAGDYNRKDWGRWIDQDKDCQNTRHEILIKYSMTKVKLDENNCNVKSGLWICPYTGRKFTNPSDIDIDHIVPLSHAHRHGAENWTKQQRKQFANDPLNLIAVHDKANRQKSDKPPSEWMPKNKLFHDEYQKRWMQITGKYDLNHWSGP